MEKPSEQILKDLRGQIDPCDFRVIKAYISDPDSEMQQVIAVRDEEDLANVALIAVEGNLDAFQESVITGRFKVVVPSMEGVEDGYRQYAISFEEIPDNRMCQVICAPPVFVIFVTDRKWE